MATNPDTKKAPAASSRTNAKTTAVKTATKPTSVSRTAAKSSPVNPASKVAAQRSGTSPKTAPKAQPKTDVATVLRKENVAASALPSVQDAPLQETPVVIPAAEAVTTSVLETAPTTPSPMSEPESLSASLLSDPADLLDGDEAATEPAKDPMLGLTDDAESEDNSEDNSDFNEMRIQLMALQQEIRTAQIPVVVVFEGWDAAGKGTMLSKLIEGLDPRGYQVYTMHKPSEHDQLYPAMRRYWVNMPEAGSMSLFCSSWYREVSKACMESKSARKRLNQNYQAIVNLESQLVTDGVLLIKFFLHIPRKEQKRRLKELESKKSTRWRVVKEDWYQNEHYEEYLRLYDAMIARTHFDGALWHVLRSDNKSLAIRQMYGIVIESFQAALRDRKAGLRAWDVPFLPHLESIETVTFPSLETFDPEQALSEPYKPAIDAAQKRLSKLQNDLYRRAIPMVICFEGWDAAGKGGVISRLTSAQDARGFDVVPISAPTPLEKSHHYLWRFWHALPQNGHTAIFDRTWYGRVMVERVEGFCTEPQWKRAYEEINRFEADIASQGTILCKFWLQIDSATQLIRFNDRKNTPEKQWKITEEDWRNREKWPLYENAVNEMLQKTNTAYAPWTVVEANNKQYARLKVIETVIRAIEIRLAEEKD